MATINQAKEALRVAKAIQKDVNEILQCPFTTREKEILFLIASGLSYFEIGQQLKISESTVKNHMGRVLHKLDAKDKTRAVVIALQHGWIEFPG